MIMLNEKEKMLLEEEKKHEQLCIDKYNEYVNKASDVELKNLFGSLSQKEQQHLQSINQMLSGTVPNVNSGSSGGQSQSSQSGKGQSSDAQMKQSQSSNSMSSSSASNENSTQTLNSDKMLCEDTLSTEKYVSSTYNTAIFEFRDTNVRQVLNHIQKEEQEHGEAIYNYMNSHGIYN